MAARGQDLPSLPPEVIVTHEEREGRGPLEGLRAGLEALPGEVDAAYVTSCDVPLLVPGFVRQMLDLSRGWDVAVMEIDGFPHPLSAVYRRATLPHVEDLLAHDRLRPVFLYERVLTRRVAPAEMTADPDFRTLRNLNTPDDYAAALREARAVGSGPWSPRLPPEAATLEAAAEGDATWLRHSGAVARTAVRACMAHYPCDD